jgi:hypothetical protein
MVYEVQTFILQNQVLENQVAMLWVAYEEAHLARTEGSLHCQLAAEALSPGTHKKLNAAHSHAGIAVGPSPVKPSEETPALQALWLHPCRVIQQGLHPAKAWDCGREVWVVLSH